MKKKIERDHLFYGDKPSRLSKGMIGLPTPTLARRKSKQTKEKKKTANDLLSPPVLRT